MTSPGSAIVITCLAALAACRSNRAEAVSLDLAAEADRQVVVDREPRELPRSLTGDRRAGVHAPDGAPKTC